MCHMSGVKFHVAGVTCHMSGVTCQVSGVRSQVSGVRYHMSQFIFKFFVEKVVELVGGGSVINRAYLV